jgi:hypothetical protein
MIRLNSQSTTLGALTIGECVQVSGKSRDEIRVAMRNGALRFQTVAASDPVNGKPVNRRMVDPAALREFVRGGGRRHAR